MSAQASIWIDRLEKLEVDGDGVRLWLSSDDAFIKLRLSRHQLRMLVERGGIALAEAAGIDRHKLVELERRSPRHG